MYTGTLIQELMATVERAELSAQQKQIVDQGELERIFKLQFPSMQGKPVFMGAA